MARKRIIYDDDQEESQQQVKEVKFNSEEETSQQENQDNELTEISENNHPRKRRNTEFSSIMNDKDYQFDTTVDAFMQNVPDSFDIPDTIPVLPTIKRSIQHLSSSRGIRMLSIIKDMQKKIIDSVDVQLVNRMSTEKDSLDGLLDKPMDDIITEIGLLNSIKAIDTLCELEAKVLTSDESIEDLKSFFKPSTEQTDFTLDTLSECMDPAYQNSFQNIEDKYNADSEGLLEKHREETRNSALIARQHIFIILHPKEPLPGNLLPNSDDEGDLEVSGGTIELVCPISKTLLTDPVIAPCGHSFSKNEIMQFIRQNLNCPIPGCNKTISSRNLKPDYLMKLRVSSYEAQKESEVRKRRKNLETVF